MADFSAFERAAARDFSSLEIRANEPLKNYTTFKIGGTARLFAQPQTEEELAFLLRAAKEHDVRAVVIGCGSNLLFADGEIDALIIRTGRLSGISRAKNELTALAGCPLPALAVYAQRNALSGLEFAQGIPGSVGGGAVMNAGAYGYDISMVCKSVRYINRATFETGDFFEKDLAFGYRKSVFMERPELIVLSAVFALEPDDENEIRIRMEDYAKRRSASQPLDFPSAGSTFKRPEGYFAGKLIEDCGLKGLRVGGACVSPKHAGFIINAGGATCQDVLYLIEKIQETVYCRFGLELECEIKHIK